jgi:hypothetical protein
MWTFKYCLGSIYGNMWTFKYCLGSIHDMHSFDSHVPMEIDERIMYVTYDQRDRVPLYCLILPWFDRLDRMIFCKYLKNLLQFEDCSRVSLVIFIQRYL